MSVGCARKIEMTRWPRLFDIVGNPKILFEVRALRHLQRSRSSLTSTVIIVQTCLGSGRLKTAGSYLLVLHGLEQLEGMNGDATRLLRSALAAEDWQLCRELLRFLHSIDESGAALRNALQETDLLSLPSDDTP